jgi:hypothetical protein
MTMTGKKGIDWKNVTFVMGTRADLAPHSLPQPVFSRSCGNCQALTYTETEYPHDVPVLCNVCSATVTAQDEGAADTLLLYDMPADLKARLIDSARERRLPIEVVCKDFIEWKLGRPTKARLSTTAKKQKAKG